MPADQQNITLTTYRIEKQGRLWTVVRRDLYGPRGRQGFKDRTLGAYNTRQQAQRRINEIRSKRSTPLLGGGRKTSTSDPLGIRRPNKLS
jgi:hypothetical protein